ncbi:uncharacterized protein N7459_010111 [Penicillium hispanicum]|uniref:uncharacterized protein n=1 Tax=Penicillium hispanicum TaxID=1080232 RepID=UPI00254255AC|nr:uncharacterized protein N7459_010111 [Penicillium hispanicum]KAJ5566729.1 hypothetical protein N7459_010111 [Penicillium hispanicum]
MGRQKHRLILQNLERYKNEQPVVDSERQLSGKVVDEEVMVKKEYERRIAAINAVIAVCDAEEGAPSRPRGA